MAMNERGCPNIALKERFEQRFNLMVILGPTASGKTRMAVSLARRIGGEIISADSRQVYRGMDLGTGKDLLEYSRDGLPVKYHLIDIIEPTEEFSLYLFLEHFHRAFNEIIGNNRIPVLVGGTGLYIDAVLRGYHVPKVEKDEKLWNQLEKEETEALIKTLMSLRPDLHNSTDLTDRRRLMRAIEIAKYRKEHPDYMPFPIGITPLVIGIRLKREALRQNIKDRLMSRLESGLIEEVRRLHERGISWERLESFGLEYRYAALYLKKALTFDDMVRWLTIRIGQFAKRQETWFKGMERKGVKIHWISGPNVEEAIEVINRIDG